MKQILLAYLLIGADSTCLYMALIIFKYIVSKSLHNGSNGDNTVSDLKI